jgi:hypothetical protein
MFLAHVLSHVNPVNTKICFTNIDLHIVLPLTSRSFKTSLSFRFPGQNYVDIYGFLMLTISSPI